MDKRAGSKKKADISALGEVYDLNYRSMEKINR
ncbi:hypothetical protein SAMN05518670_2469 [Paenibacillus sp. OK076]|nr:hypothetical protein SAMN05518670_2469 [Paenibacillus sp. OK076]